MATYTERVQTLLSKEQFRALERLSRKSHKPISILLRDAVESIYFRKIALDQRRAAVRHLTSLDAPVSGWEQMEKEIATGARKK